MPWTEVLPTRVLMLAWSNSIEQWMSWPKVLPAWVLLPWISWLRTREHWPPGSHCVHVVRHPKRHTCWVRSHCVWVEERSAEVTARLCLANQVVVGVKHHCPSSNKMSRGSGPFIRSWRSRFMRLALSIARSAFTPRTALLKLRLDACLLRCAWLNCHGPR